MSERVQLVLLGVGAAYGLGLALVTLYLVRDVLLLTFLAWVVAAALRPPVDALDRWLPRAAAAGIVYLLFLALLGLVLVVAVPPVAREVVELAERFPEYVGELQAGFRGLQEWLVALGVPVDLDAELRGFARTLAQGAFALARVPLAAFQVVLSTFAVLALSFYWLLTRETVVEWVCSWLPERLRQAARSVFERAERQMGAYVRGLAFLAFAVGTLTLIGLVLIKVPFAITLAVLAGFLELLPIVGPVIAAVPAIIVAATQSPLQALLVLVLFIIVQQLENYLLVPKVHETSVGLNPLVVLLAVILGSGLAGVAGAVLAVPVAALIALLLDVNRGGARRSADPVDGAPAAAEKTKA